jgi:hypothetical protein
MRAIVFAVFTPFYFIKAGVLVSISESAADCDTGARGGRKGADDK